MSLMESLSWAVVELQSAKPDMHEVKMALEQAYMEAARLDFKAESTKKNLIKMCQMGGMDDTFPTGGLK